MGPHLPFANRVYKIQVTVREESVNRRGARILSLFCVPCVLTRQGLTRTLVGYQASEPSYGAVFFLFYMYLER